MFFWALGISLFTIIIVGGIISIMFEMLDAKFHKNRALIGNHGARWSKDLTFLPNHPNCKGCEKLINRYNRT